MNPQEFHEIITEVTDYSGNGKHFQYINKFSQEVGFYWFFALVNKLVSIQVFW